MASDRVQTSLVLFADENKRNVRRELEFRGKMEMIYIYLHTRRIFVLPLTSVDRNGFRMRLSSRTTLVRRDL